MTKFAVQVAYHLNQYRQGNRDDAFFGLIEMNHDVVPELINSFQKESEPQTRAFLVEVIWEHRQQSSISFLAEVLQESDVWKEALNGLVTLASPVALEGLRSARNRQFSKKKETDEFREWLEEAITQVEAQL